MPDSVTDSMPHPTPESPINDALRRHHDPEYVPFAARQRAMCANPAPHTHHDIAHEHHHDGEEVPIYDRGLQFDVATLLSRRRALGVFAGAALVPLLGAGAAAASSRTAAGGIDACADIPEETAGPYPADGSNGPNVLDDAGIVRHDIRSSFGGPTGRARGVELTMRYTVLDLAAGCAPYAGAAFYVWQCDREERYSLYSPGAENENYLRGVQVADAKGRVSFRTIFPGCYAGRWPHIHFEVYPDVESATTFRNKIATSQLAFPKKVCKKVYATKGYEQSLVNLSRVSLETDGVFRDGWEQQLAKMKGSPAKGYRSKLSLAV